MMSTFIPEFYEPHCTMIDIDIHCENFKILMAST